MFENSTVLHDGKRKSYPYPNYYGFECWRITDGDIIKKTNKQAQKKKIIKQPPSFHAVYFRRIQGMSTILSQDNQVLLQTAQMTPHQYQKKMKRNGTWHHEKRTGQHLKSHLTLNPDGRKRRSGPNIRGEEWWR